MFGKTAKEGVMVAWNKQERRPFDVYPTDDGFYYEAVGTKDNPEEIAATEIIKALNS